MHYFILSSLQGLRLSGHWGCWLVVAVVQSSNRVWLFVTPWTAASRLLCPSASPGVCPSSCPVNRWCHPIISCCPFSSSLLSFPASGSFPVSQLFTSGGQSTEASTLASVLSMNIQGWFPLGLLVWSPCCPRYSQESFPAPHFESINSSALYLLYYVALINAHDYWKDHSLDWSISSNKLEFRCDQGSKTAYWKAETLLCQQRSI